MKKWGPQRKHMPARSQAADGREFLQFLILANFIDKSFIGPHSVGQARSWLV